MIATFSDHVSLNFQVVDSDVSMIEKQTVINISNGGEALQHTVYNQNGDV